MNTNNTFKSKEESVSHNFGDSNLKVNKNGGSTSSAFVISNHKERYEEKTDNSIKETGLSSPLPKRNNTDPRLKVSVDFAASQWFQILLVHLNSKNKSLNGVLEPIGECHLGLNG
jgi:hypothetical protein